jgi:hypothetical protein
VREVTADDAGQDPDPELAAAAGPENVPLPEVVDPVAAAVPGAAGAAGCAEAAAAGADGRVRVAAGEPAP